MGQALLPAFLRRRSDAGRAYGVAILTTALAVAGALAIDLPLHADTNLLPVAAVAVSAWYGGTGPGTVAVLLSVLALDYVLIPPPFRWKRPGFEPEIYLGAFLFVSLVVNRTADSLRRARGDAQRRAAELETLTERLAQQMEEVQAISEDLQRSNAALSEALDASERTADRATKLAKTRADVLGIVAHDLRNPLSSIGSATQFMLETPLPAEDRERLLRVALRGVRRMNRLIGDLLDATRLEAGHLRLAYADVDVGDLLHQAMETCRPAADEHKIALVVHVPDGPTTIRADEDRLLQVLANLIGNAVKFTPPGGRVDVTATRTGPDVVFQVSDDGPGIPADVQPMLFERFWQARDGDHRGVGLGLAIAKGIVEAHGGRIWVESAPGAGSTFSFTIPVTGTATG